MFKFTPNLTFGWPVKVIEPNPNKPGELTEHEFQAQFEMLPPDEAKASAKKRQAIAAKIAPELTDSQIEDIQAELDEHDRSGVLRVLRGWDKLADAEGKPIPFSPTTFEMVYAYRHIRNALVRAYIEALSEDKARLGN